MKKNTQLDKQVVLVGPTVSIHDTIVRLAEKRVPNQIDGIAVVVNEKRNILGVITDGDIRRAFARGTDFSLPVQDIMVRDPISVSADLSASEAVEEAVRKVRSTKRLRSIVRFVLQTDSDRRLVGVLDVTEHLFRMSSRQQNVGVYGMGHVGVTLAASLGNVGHLVTGYDPNAEVRTGILSGNCHVLEPGLNDLLSLLVKKNQLKVQAALDSRDHGIHIVAVGTPVDAQGKADVSAVLTAGETVAKALKSGDLVMIRSTVPVGFTRNRFVPMLEKVSGLSGGEDFYVSFCPERTIEGRALQELRALPQIVGGLSDACLEKAASFWSTLTQTVVRVDSLEAAEVIKVANNTFRDLSFAFSNELALLCDSFNLNSFRVIEAANEGYPRNPIPLPSPGVGGYCLTKDPLLYGQPWSEVTHRPRLGLAGRQINEIAAAYPTQTLERWAKRQGRGLADLNVVIVGMAFKGVPETADIRGSTSLDVARALTRSGARVTVWDAIVPPANLTAAGFTVSTHLSEAIAQSDAVIILNNHPSHPVLGIARALVERPKPRLVFDGWNQLDAREIEQIDGTSYGTMGYLTGSSQ